ncbi:MAG: DUF4474 domain-containing protein [Bacilli bacterium]|nr:DUF4474 domain-containing protein [Bacilli bacterium]
MLDFMIYGQFLLFIILAIFIFVIIIFFVHYQIIQSLIEDKNKSLAPLDINQLNKELEPFGFAYSSKQDIFFSIMYPWQRTYGYCRSYDEVSPLVSIIIDCEPIYFKYNNRKWLIEFWKGQYGMTTGGEIGIYVANEDNKDPTDTFYGIVTDEERITMTYILKKKKKSLITRNARHWWLTGFKLGEYSKPKDLVMEISVSLKNNTMVNAFKEALLKTGYSESDIKVFNQTVNLIFDKPRTKQPVTRNFFTNLIMQSNNKRNCKLYNKLTKNYNNSLEKINFIRNNFPLLYSQIMDFEKNKQIFQKYRPTPNNPNN